MSLARRETLQILFPPSTSPTVEEMLAKMQEPANPDSAPYQPPKELSVIEEAAFVPLPNVHPWAIRLPEDDEQHLKKTSRDGASQGFMWLAKRVAEDGGVKKARPVPRKDSSSLKLEKRNSTKSVVARASATRANRER